MENYVSERSILLGRIQKKNISERLRFNLEQLEVKQERLSMSRVSSQSSKSRRSLGQRRAASSADLRQVTPKVKLLLQISDKLKSSKHKLFETPKKIVEPEPSPQEKKVQYSSDVKRTSKAGKLESMLKDIKRCNQMSTKAVSSIKKPFKNGQEFMGYAGSQSSIRGGDKEQSKLGGLFSELIGVRQELRRVKEQNRLLVKLIDINEAKNQRLSQDREGEACHLCGCSCRRRNKQTQRQNEIFSSNGFHNKS